MRILIIEDDENKLARVREIAEYYPHVTTVVIATSLKNGIKKGIEEEIDLVLLDMTLPTFDVSPGESGGTMHPFGGMEFLRQMRRWQSECAVIVITQFETFGEPPNVKDLAELKKDLEEDFRPEYRGLIYYHSDIGTWERELRDLIKEIGQGKKARPEEKK